MEWAHTAQIFGSTLESLRQSHSRAGRECQFGIDKRAATSFLTSFCKKSHSSLQSSFDGGKDAMSLNGPLSFHNDRARDTATIDLTKKAGWRHRLVHWFTDTHSPDKENETSYYELLHTPVSAELKYDPLELDYAGLYWALTDHQKMLLSKAGIGEYIPPSDLLTADISSLPELPTIVTKEQLNNHFVMSHPLINRSFTGSKLRAIRRLLADLIPEYQLATCAAAWVYFEKLVMMNKVNKENRRVVFGACFSLSCKFHEDKRNTAEVINAVASRFSSDVVPREIAENEFHVFAALGFNLRIKEEHLLPHMLALENDSSAHTVVDVL